MRNIIILILAVGLSLPSFAQGVFSQLKLKRVGVSLGVEEDLIRGFGFDSFVKMTGEENLAQILDVEPGALEQYSGICEAPHLRLQAIWVPQALPNLEWHTSLVAALNRVDAITYYSQNELSYYDNYLTLNTWESEIAVDLGLMRRFNGGPFSFYVGGGTNLGATFDHAMYVYSSYDNVATSFSFEETGIRRDIRGDVDMVATSGNETLDLDPQSGLAQRLYVQGGGSVTLFRRVEIGAEGRMGVGYRYNRGGEAFGTNMRSWGFFARWVLK